MECCLCDCKCETKNDLVKHMLIHKDSANVILYKCESCGHKTEQLGNFRSHILKHKGLVDDLQQKLINRVYPRKKKNKNMKTKIFQCDQCPIETNALYLLKRHKLTHKHRSERKLYECKLCNVKYLYKKSLEVHVLRHNETSKMSSYQCDSCGFETIYKYVFKKHKESHANRSKLDDVEEKIYKCNDCSFRTSKFALLELHMFKIHKSGDADGNDLESKKFKCDQCSFRTAAVIRLNRHKLTHKDRSERKLFKCDQCGVQCTTKGALKCHMLRHEDSSRVPEFQCDVCKYKTIYKYLFDRHNKSRHVHRSQLETAEEVEGKKYKCGECSYRTVVPSKLERHKLTHKDRSERRSYECVQCGKKCMLKRSLETHMLLHKKSSEVPVFECDLCDYKTIYKSALNKHKLKRDHTEINMVGDLEERTDEGVRGSEQTTDSYETQRCECEVCSAKFTDQFKLEMHILCHNGLSSVETMHESDFNQHKSVHVEHPNQTTKLELYGVNFNDEIKHYECKFCNAEFMDKFTLKMHVLCHKNPPDVHKSKGMDRSGTKSKRFKCEKCPFETAVQERLRRHKQTHQDRSERKLYGCDQCGAQYTTNSTLKTHVLLHKNPSDVPKYHCNVCGYQTIYKSALRRHELTHVDRSNGKSIDTEASYVLKNHRLTRVDRAERGLHQRGVKKSLRQLFECGQHEDSFDISTWLKRQCHICGFKTGYKTLLYQHILRHKSTISNGKNCVGSLDRDGNSIEILECCVCDYKFKFQSEFLRHMLVHKDGGNLHLFKCDLCGHKTEYLGSLKLHILTHSKSRREISTNVNVNLQTYM